MSGGLVVGSKDVKAHYPEIDINVGSEEIKKIYILKSLTWMSMLTRKNLLSS